MEWLIYKPVSFPELSFQNQSKSLLLFLMLTFSVCVSWGEHIGGGIVFDSDPTEEWLETMNKLGANMQCITSAEERYLRIQEGEERK